MTIMYYETDISYDSFISNQNAMENLLLNFAIITNDNYFCLTHFSLP